MSDFFLFGGRAKNKHDWVRLIEFNRLLRETDLWVQGLRIFLTASTLAGTRAINEHDPVLASAQFRSFFAVLQCQFRASALAVKNIHKPWTHKLVSLNNRLNSIDGTQSYLLFALAPAPALCRCQKYTQTLNSQIGLSQKLIKLNCVFFALAPARN